MEISVVLLCFRIIAIFVIVNLIRGSERKASF